MSKTVFRKRKNTDQNCRLEKDFICINASRGFEKLKNFYEQDLIIL